MYDLGNHFKPDFNKLAVNEKQMVKGQKYRITILSESLLRLEYSETGTFYDGPTRLVLDRKFEYPAFKINQDQRFLMIDTNYFRLEYNKEKPFNSGSLKVTINATGAVWYYGNPEAKNFLGLFNSFDIDKRKFKGLYNLDGFVMLDDSNNKVINLDGTISERDPKYTDLYLFTYGKDFNQCLKDYYHLTGNPPLIPRYALGCWWSKNTNYTSEDILKTVKNFNKHDIPISVFLLDKDWHTREFIENEQTRELFTGYTFNRFLIPEPEKTFKELHDKNIRVGLQVNPKEGIHSNEDNYEEAIKYLGIPNGKPIDIDYNDPKYLDVYLKMFVEPLENLGADFFWNDYDVKDKNDELFFLNNYHFKDLERDVKKRSMILGRNSGIAPHRYPVTYTGKTEISWIILRDTAEVILDAANNGVSYVSTDVAGNHGGIEDSELYIRSVELGCFSPIFRFHSARGHYYKKEPWMWDPKTLTITHKYMNLRHKLLPYLYTEAHKYYEKGVPFIRPLYYDVPDLYDDSICRDEYYFGSSLLVAPITTKKDPIMDRTVHKFYIPEGVWYDLNTGKTFNGNKRYTSFFKEDDYPVFVKSGTILPLSLKSNLNNVGNPSDMEIVIYPGASSHYTLYEDDGVTSLYKDGYYLETSIEYNYNKDNYTVLIRSLKGKKGIVPDERNYKFRFVNTKTADQISAFFDNSQKPVDVYLEDNDLIIEVNNVSSVGNLVLNVKGKDIEIGATRAVNDEIDSILMDLQINTYVKERISSIMFSSMPMKDKRIEIRKLKRDGLSSQYIKLFLNLLEYVGEI